MRASWVDALTRDFHTEPTVGNRTALIAPVPLAPQRSQWRAEPLKIRSLYRTPDAKTRTQRRAMRSDTISAERSRVCRTSRGQSHARPSFTLAQGDCFAVQIGHRPRHAPRLYGNAISCPG